MAGVEVTLLDGKWIAEQLGDPELVWIGRRYLELSEAMLPSAETPNGLDAGYLAARDRWRQTDTPRPVPGDFYELRAGLRTATEPGVARPDLPLWLSRMERLLQPGLDEDLAIRARYELAVATLIGQRDLRPADHHVAALFADVAKWDHPFRLQDAQVLLTFLYGMVGAGRSGLRPAQLAQWHEALRARLDELVAEESLPTRRAYRDSRLVWRARIGSRMSTVAERLSLSPTESGRGVGRRVARLRRSNQGGGKDPRSDLFGNHWYHSLQPSRVRARYATAGTKEASGARGKLSTATHDLLATFVPQRAATFR